ncbi:MAG: hypothetical protein ACOY94_10655 [Bacillota bacterium]
MNYFSLNRWIEHEEAAVMAHLQMAVGMEQLTAEGTMTHGRVRHTNLDHWITYGGILVGILFQRVSSAGYQLDPSKFSVPLLVSSIVLSCAIYPHLSNKAKFSKNTPFMVRFGTAIQNGIAWPAVMEGILKVAGSGT